SGGKTEPAFLLCSLVQRRCWPLEIKVPSLNSAFSAVRNTIWVSRPGIAITGAQSGTNLVNDSLHALIGFVSDHSGWAYATVFPAALLEGVPVLGSFVPGSTVIVAISALVPIGQLSLPMILTSAIVGAAIGDGAAFWLGHRLKRHILELWPLSA